jgi:heterocyst glycolipid deposition protein
MKCFAMTSTFLLCLLLTIPGAQANELEGPTVPFRGTVTLADAQQLAMEKNPQMDNLDELIRQADLGLRRAWTTLLPNVSARGSATRNQREIALEFPDFSAFDPTNPAAPLPTGETVLQEQWGQSFGLTANMVLFDPGSVTRIASARDTADRTRLTAHRRRNDLLHSVAVAYYQAQSMKEMVQVAGQNLELANALKQISVEREQGGLGSRVDVLRAEIQLARAGQELANARDATRLSLRALAQLMGHEGDLIIAGTLHAAQVAGDLAELTKDALGERIELREAGLSEAVARRNEDADRLRWLPVFDVTYDWAWSSTEGFGGDHDQWMVIFGARWSLLEGGRRIVDLKTQRSRTRMARNDLTQLRIDIGAQVEQAYIQAKTRERNVEFADTQHALAQENLDLVDRQYRAGIATSLDAMNAATELRNQRVGRVLSRLQYDMALLGLGQAIGRVHSLSTVEPR